MSDVVPAKPPRPDDECMEVHTVWRFPYANRPECDDLLMSFIIAPEPSNPKADLRMDVWLDDGEALHVVPWRDGCDESYRVEPKDLLRWFRWCKGGFVGERPPGVLVVDEATP